MGDVLPPKRDTVERLRRRVEHYRGHHNACLPRYEQAASSLREAERHETLLLKQRYLESKAKKAKNKNEHHRTYKESDGSKSQLAKPLKRSAEEPIASALPQSTSNEETERAAKLARTDSIPEKKPDLPIPPQQTCLNSALQTKQSSQQTSSTLSNFSVQIVQQFSNHQSSLKPSVQTNVNVQNLPKPLNSPIPQVPLPAVPSQTEALCNQDESSQSSSSARNTGLCNSVIECKQEKDIDELCQFKNVQSTNNHLPDTFPSIGDDSGEDMLPPDVLKDLIEDVATNHDLMTDFFDVGSMKNVAKDSSSFQSDNVASTNQQQQLNGMFRNFANGDESPISTMSPNTPVTTTSTLYNQPAQRPPYMNPGVDCLRFDCKIDEPTGSLAARTLKQLAEQHQNLQQQQVSSLATRFNQGYINQGTMQNTEKASNIYSLSEEFFPNCEQLSPRFDKQREASNQQIEQPPPYGTTRPLTHFSEQTRPSDPISGLSHSPVGSVQNSSDLRFQQQAQVHMRGPQQMMQQDILESKKNHYTNYSSSPFHIPPTLPPPPEYKSPHHNQQPMYGKRPPHNWRTPHQNQFRVPNYGSLPNGTSGAPLSPLYNQYRGNQIPNGHMARPNMMPPVLLHQRTSQCQRSPTMTSTILNNNSMSPIGSYIGSKDVVLSPLVSFAGQKDIINNQMNLDLFDGVPDLFDLSEIV